jgi:hypothetical protein
LTSNPSYAQYVDVFWQERVVELRDPVQACRDAARLVEIDYPKREPESDSRFQTDIQVLREYPQTTEVAELMVSRLERKEASARIFEELEQTRNLTPRERQERVKEANEISDQARKMMQAIAEIMQEVEPMLRMLIEEKIRSGSREKREVQERYTPAFQQQQKRDEPKPIPYLPDTSSGGNSRCPLPRVPVRTPTTLPSSLSGIHGRTNDHRKNFFDFYPEFKQFENNLDIHHAVPQVVLDKYRGLFTVGEMHSINNLRGICVPWRRYVHDVITASWKRWYEQHPRATR